VTGAFRDSFVHETRDLRVVSGPGCAERVGEEVERLGVGRALVVTTPRGRAAAEGMIASLDARVVHVFDGARLHVPFSASTGAVAAARRYGADVVVAPGGGSAIGTAKAVALALGLPIVALPTTYSGSEMTRVWGLTREGRKYTGRDPRVAPRVVLYDPLLTLDLPPDTSAASGMNAVAHAVEALYAPDVSPLARLLAEEGIRALARALPEVVRAPRDLPARGEALYGAHLCGWALDLTSMGLHHRLAHVLGGGFDLPHALVHAILLPHTAAFNAAAAKDAMAVVARALGESDPDRAPGALDALNRRLGITATLRELGLDPEKLDWAAGQAAEGPGYPNPRPVDREGIRALLEGPWRGNLPTR
jgi:maleylacetate reductase